MRITLELTEPQAKVFQDIIDTALKAVIYQEAVIKDEIQSRLHKEDNETAQELRYLNDYKVELVPQRLLLAEIAHTIQEAEKKTSIITHTDFEQIPKTKKRK